MTDDELMVPLELSFEFDGSRYRVGVPCALYLDASTVAELKEKLFAVFGNEEWHAVQEAGEDVVFYPGWSDEQIEIIENFGTN